MGEIDIAFVQDPEHRPKLSIIEVKNIPLIDLSTVYSSSSDPKSNEELVREVGSACREWGFFQVINHGVPKEILHNIENAAKEFFAQPLEEKRKVKRDEEKVTSGYYDSETTMNVRDWKEVFDFAVQEPTLIRASPDPDDKRVVEWKNRWPQYPPGFRETCEEYAKEMEKLAFNLMELIALSLGLEAKRFNSYFKEKTSFIRLNHYPPCPSPHLALGVGIHKDVGVLTILAQDEVPGLEVKSKTGDWILVKPIPDSYIVNVGDITQVFSNDRYESVEHRAVLNPDKERFSIPFFFNPAHYTIVKPMEELIDEQNPPKFKPYSWGEYMTHRKKVIYKKLNTDQTLQVRHLRVES